jgi:hypothetical protein
MPWFHGCKVIESYCNSFVSQLHLGSDTRVQCMAYVQGAIIRVLTYRRYANITVWYFFVFSHVPRRYTVLVLSAYLFSVGTT